MYIYELEISIASKYIGYNWNIGNNVPKSAEYYCNIQQKTKLICWIITNLMIYIIYYIHRLARVHFILLIISDFE